MLLPDLLASSADQLPDKPSAVFPSERITFAALDRAADQVARYLNARGIGPGRRVALLYENSQAALIWFWGVLKSRAAYDRSDPRGEPPGRAGGPSTTGAALE